MNRIKHIATVPEMHQYLGMSEPLHPLITVIRNSDFDLTRLTEGEYTMDLYQVSLKSSKGCELTYGRMHYDYEQGTMVFTKPGQVISLKKLPTVVIKDGWSLLFHPELIRLSSLAARIEQFHFFSYEVHEALHLSEPESTSLLKLVEGIEEELQARVDQHSQRLLSASVELILDYCTRYYDRQFLMRTNMHQDVMGKFETLLSHYFAEQQQLEHGLPNVSWCAKKLHMSPHYLGDLLRKETGRSTQQHIHRFIIEKAKHLLLSSNENISVIAYDLGFDYPQHLSKLFKTNTGMTPIEYRKAH